MAIEGVDYSRTAHSNSPSVAALNAMGKNFAGRYAVNDKSPSGRGITAAEYQRLAAGGIDVFLYWEGVAAWMLDGGYAGVLAARNAQANIAAAGMPPETPVYFAHDIDPQPIHFGLVNDCLAGAASVVGAERVGIYGGWLLMEHCAQVGNARWFCQTRAWEYGHGLHPAAHLYQYGFNAWIDNTNCDLVRAMTENYGQASPTGNQPRFQVGDQIKVVDGPLNIRPQASTDGMPEGMFETNTELCVREGPAFGEGYEWYRVDGANQDGWVAGNFCGMVERGGCGAADGGQV
jgi:hypothetical protein